MKPLLRYVGKLTLTPAKITPEDAGAVLAQTDHPVLLEGNVYFPPEDARREYLVKSRAWSLCPWKGLARYYTVAARGQHNKLSLIHI